jgi:CelD/BcsL family acetyltransferase involved in cellulose biosynthesis
MEETICPSTKLSLIQADSPKWLEFIQARPDATLFHHPAWIHMLSEYYHFKAFILVVEDDQANILAGMPIMEIDGLFHKKRWESLPFTDHCAPLFQDHASFDRLVSGLISLYHNQKIKRVELRWEYPTSSKLCTDTKYMINMVKLGPEPQAVAARIKRKDFRQIKVAEERGVYVELGTSQRQLKEFYSLHLQNRRKHGVPVQSWRYFKYLSNHLLEKGFGFIASAYKGQTCIAASIFLYWNQSLIYKYAASNDENHHLYGMDKVIWAAICRGCQDGMQVLDMGRSLNSDKGLRDYKNRWGGQENPLTYSYIPTMPVQRENNRLVPMLETVIRLSPPWICRLTGELFYQYFA